MVGRNREEMGRYFGDNRQQDGPVTLRPIGRKKDTTKTYSQYVPQMNKIYARVCEYVCVYVCVFFTSTVRASTIPGAIRDLLLIQYDVVYWSRTGK